MSNQSNPTPREVTATAAYALAHEGNGIVVDVREPWEWEQGHAAGAAHMPLNSVPTRHVELPNDRPVLVICASGNRSVTAARYLAGIGYDARSVTGGTAAWSSQRLPLELGIGVTR
ncbi:MAG: rhodanese-like domain-containing protein [Chloroflexi bacterium]|nr:rhodanese-like domain-containing protein [Chloroflexota bacterium]MDA1146969.1 rhodanese-like domain-containing protein [Chloroflexota bacterium]